MFVHINIRTYILYVLASFYTYVCMYICTYVRTYVHVCFHNVRRTAVVCVCSGCTLLRFQVLLM